MKTFVIEVPYTASFTIQNSTRIEITEDQILDYFEVDNIDDVSGLQLQEYFRDQAEDIDVSRNTLSEQFAEEVLNNRCDFEVLVNEIETMEKA